MDNLKFTAEQYVDDVLSGRQVACQWVRLACERYVRDLREAGERGLVFDEGAAYPDDSCARIAGGRY